MTKEEILRRSEELGVMDIRFDIENPTLEDYSKALDSIEESHMRITPELLEKVRATGKEGLKY